MIFAGFGILAGLPGGKPHHSIGYSTAYVQPDAIRDVEETRLPERYSMGTVFGAGDVEATYIGAAGEVYAQPIWSLPDQDY